MDMEPDVLHILSLKYNSSKSLQNGIQFED